MVVFLRCLLNPAVLKKYLRWFFGFFSKFCVGGWFFTCDMNIKKKAYIILQLFIFWSGNFTSPCDEKNAFLCFFCTGTQCLRRRHKFLSFFLRYYENLDILPQHGRYQQKFRCWNRQKLFFLKNPIFKIHYKIGQNSIGFFKKINFCRF